MSGEQSGPQGSTNCWALGGTCIINGLTVQHLLRHIRRLFSLKGRTLKSPPATLFQAVTVLGARNFWSTRHAHSTSRRLAASVLRGRSTSCYRPLRCYYHHILVTIICPLEDEPNKGLRTLTTLIQVLDSSANHISTWTHTRVSSSQSLVKMAATKMTKNQMRRAKKKEQKKAQAEV